MDIGSMASTASNTGKAGILEGLFTTAGMIQNQYNADKTRQFNRQEAEKNREFQKEMAQNNIKYAVNQAKELGISPSLVLGEQTTSLGGSQASVGNVPTYNASGVGKIIQEQQKMKLIEEMNEDKLEAIKEMHEDRLAAMKNSTTGNSMKNKYTKEQLNSLITDLNNFDYDKI